MASPAKRARTTAAGYDLDRFSSYSDQDLDEFKCGICLGVLREPMETPCCRQTFCRTCVEAWLSGKTKPTCSICRKKLYKRNLIRSSNIVKNLIDNLKIDCENQGCDETVKLGDLRTHLDRCKFRPDAPCQDCGLNFTSKCEHDCIIELKRANDKLTNELDQVKFQLVSSMGEISKLEQERSELCGEVIMINNKIYKQNDVILAQQSLNKTLEKVIIQLQDKVSCLENSNFVHDNN